MNRTEYKNQIAALLANRKQELTKEEKIFTTAKNLNIDYDVPLIVVEGADTPEDILLTERIAKKLNRKVITIQLISRPEEVIKDADTTKDIKAQEL